MTAQTSTLPGKPLGRSTLFEALAEQIEEWILSGEVKSGAKMPSEEALAAQFKISRPMVREALARLRERGLVETVNGSGTYVRDPDPERLADAMRRHIQFAAAGPRSVKNLFEARIAVEAQTASLAAERATDLDLAEIRERFAAMRHARSLGDKEMWAEADPAFHLAVAGASHNPFLTTLLTPLIEVIRLGSFQGYNPNATNVGLVQHRRIVDAIASGKPDAAREAMVKHLMVSERNLAKMAQASSTETRDR